MDSRFPAVERILEYKLCRDSSIDLLSHYTSLESVQKILNGKKIRLSHWSNFVDKSEFNLFFNEFCDKFKKYNLNNSIVNSFCRSFIFENPTVSALAKFINKQRNFRIVDSNYALSMLGASIEYLGTVMEADGPLGISNVFVMSFVSGNSESDYMWNNYGDKGNGVRICFDGRDLSSKISDNINSMKEGYEGGYFDMDFYNVVYCNKSQIKNHIEEFFNCIVSDMCKNIIYNKNFTMTDILSFSCFYFVKFACLFKRDCYSREMESRLMVSLFSNNLDFIKKSISGPGVGEYVRGDVKYLYIEISDDIVKNIYVKNNKYNEYLNILTKLGFVDVVAV